MTAGRKNISENKSWNTPPKYVTAIEDMLGHIDLDPCSNEFSLINASKKIMLPEDGLKCDWTEHKTIFVNPPYGRCSESKTSIYDWIAKASAAYKSISEVLCLIPVATNTKHFKDIIFKESSAICFLSDTRLKFYNKGIEDKKGAPMACCVIYFGNNTSKFNQIFSTYGKVFLL